MTDVTRQLLGLADVDEKYIIALRELSNEVIDINTWLHMDKELAKYFDYELSLNGYVLSKKARLLIS